jgi:hypothetical protein
MLKYLKKPVVFIPLAIVILLGAGYIMLMGGASFSRVTGISSGGVYEEAEFFPMEAPAADFAFESTDDVAYRGGDGDEFTEEQAARGEERIVIKNANISIAVEDPGESMEDIAVRAEELGGFVVSSNLYQTYLENGLEVPEGSITIRIPAEHLLEVLDEIKASANQVLSENASGQDVTREYTDLQSRLRNLQDAETQLREIMASAIRTEDVLQVFNQLTQVSGEIEIVKGQINYYEQSAALSAISITLKADEAVQPLNIGGWEPVGVAKDAVQALVNTLQTVGDVLIWVLIYILPLAILFVVIVWFGRKMQKRFFQSKSSTPAVKE